MIRDNLTSCIQLRDCIYVFAMNWTKLYRLMNDNKYVKFYLYNLCPTILIFCHLIRKFWVRHCFPYNVLSKNHSWQFLTSTLKNFFWWINISLSVRVYLLFRSVLASSMSPPVSKMAGHCGVFQLIEALSNAPAPELALRLYLQCAEVSFSLPCKMLLWIFVKPVINLFAWACRLRMTLIWNLSPVNFLLKHIYCMRKKFR